jgi:glycosyltransferase involved in cell wall biosynthesis
VPVVASPEAAASLAAEDGRQLLVADNPTALARAVSRLADDPALATSLVAGGRALLVERHDPARVAQRLLELYTSVASGEPSR